MQQLPQRTARWNRCCRNRCVNPQPFSGNGEGFFIGRFVSKKRLSLRKGVVCGRGVRQGSSVGNAFGFAADAGARFAGDDLFDVGKGTDDGIFAGRCGEVCRRFDFRPH